MKNEIQSLRQLFVLITLAFGLLMTTNGNVTRAQVQSATVLKGNVTKSRYVGSWPKRIDELERKVRRENPDVQAEIQPAADNVITTIEEIISILEERGELIDEHSLSTDNDERRDIQDQLNDNHKQLQEAMDKYRKAVHEFNQSFTKARRREQIRKRDERDNNNQPANDRPQDSSTQPPNRNNAGTDNGNPGGDINPNPNPPQRIPFPKGNRTPSTDIIPNPNNNPTSGNGGNPGGNNNANPNPGNNNTGPNNNGGNGNGGGQNSSGNQQPGNGNKKSGNGDNKEPGSSDDGRPDNILGDIDRALDPIAMQLRYVDAFMEQWKVRTVEDFHDDLLSAPLTALGQRFKTVGAVVNLIGKAGALDNMGKDLEAIRSNPNLTPEQRAKLSANLFYDTANLKNAFSSHARSPDGGNHPAPDAPSHRTPDFTVPRTPLEPPLIRNPEVITPDTPRLPRDPGSAPRIPHDPGTTPRLPDQPHTQPDIPPGAPDAPDNQTPRGEDGHTDGGNDAPGRDNAADNNSTPTDGTPADGNGDRNGNDPPNGNEPPAAGEPDGNPPRRNPKQPTQHNADDLVVEQSDGTFKRHPTNTNDKIKGEPDPREKKPKDHVAREVLMAETIAADPNVNEVLIGKTAKEFIKTNSPATDKDVDAIGIRTDGKHILGEGKGTDTAGALKQFHAVGKALGGKTAIHSLHITTPKVGPGFKVDETGILKWAGGVTDVPPHLAVNSNKDVLVHGHAVQFHFVNIK